jgi:hypothetical protein
MKIKGNRRGLRSRGLMPNERQFRTFCRQISQISTMTKKIEELADVASIYDSRLFDISSDASAIKDWIASIDLDGRMKMKITLASSQSI